MPKRHIPTPPPGGPACFSLTRGDRFWRGRVADRCLVLRIPATTERPEDADRSTRCISPVGVDLILHGEQLTVGVQNISERDRATLIGLDSEITRLDQ